MGNIKFDKNKAKEGFFTKLVDWINTLYPFKQREKEEQSTNFKEYLRQGEKEKDDKVVAAVRLCDEALNIVSDRIVLTNRMDSVQERMTEVESYGRLTEDEANDLKDLLARYASLAKDSNALKYQVTSFDASLGEMEKLQEDAKTNLPEIKFAEERQRIFKQDISYLEGEKMMLEHANERIRNAIDFVYKFSIAMVFFFGGMSLVMIFLYIFRNLQTMVLLAAMLVLVIVVSGLLYALRNRLKYELTMNIKKQSRAVELLNKKVTVYAHFTNYLNYVYRKYKVRNSEMLANNLTDYGNYKHLTKRLDSLRNIMYQTEAQIEFFLRDKGINDNFTNLEKFAATSNIDDKKTYYDELQREKNVIEKALKRLDSRNSQIWDSLMALKSAADDDKTDGNTTIGKIVDEYVEKAGRILEADRAEGTTAMDAVTREYAMYDFDEEAEGTEE